VESARRYECRSVQSAQEYMMYLDTALALSSCNSTVVDRLFIIVHSDVAFIEGLMYVSPSNKYSLGISLN